MLGHVRCTKWSPFLWHTRDTKYWKLWETEVLCFTINKYSKVGCSISRTWFSNFPLFNFSFKIHAWKWVLNAWEVFQGKWKSWPGQRASKSSSQTWAPPFAPSGSPTETGKPSTQTDHRTEPEKEQQVSKNSLPTLTDIQKSTQNKVQLTDLPQSHTWVTNKGPSSQGYGFSSIHVWMWELDHKESWAPKNWCFWTVVLEKTLESPLDCKEIQPVHPKGN